MGQMKRLLERIQDEARSQGRDDSMDAAAREWEANSFEWTKKLMAERAAAEKRCLHLRVGKTPCKACSEEK